MKCLLYYGFLPLALALPACSQESPMSTQRPAAPLPDSASATAAAPVQHAAPAAEKVVRNMLQWYSVNMEKLPANFILHANGADTTKFYAVNFPGTENWLKSLQATGYFSDAYLNAWRAYFRRQNDTLRVHPQNDGPAAGFEYDFILYSQEADSKVQELQAGTFTSASSSPTHAVVLAAGPKHADSGSPWQEQLLLELSKSASQGWVIDAISNPRQED
ncbi:hypothetical protein [Hymenobacter sp. UYP22]|uniref:hypothetical protein n=1 Tax=Hymenobacter sp. UYP22 TaxID=3156348 RepID=UPI003398A17A